MNMKDIRAALEKAEARVDHIIWIDGAIMDDSGLPDVLVDFLDEEFDRIEECLGQLPEWLKQALDGPRYQRAEAFRDWVLNTQKLGFIVRITTPVMQPVDNKGWQFSWGYTCFNWVYAETVEQAVTLGLQWVEQMRVQEKAEASQ